jgi:hypothetical protein
MVYTIENMTLFWTTKNDIYNYTKCIPAAVYSYAWCSDKPLDTQWPSEIEELFYVGIAGGLSDDYIGDKKNINSSKVTLTTNLHQRTKSHLSKFSNRDGNFGNEKRKYELYHEHYTPLSTIGKTLYIALLLPKVHIEKESMRNILSLVESEQIYQHQKRFNKIPLLNLSESNSLGNSRKVKDSHSQQKISSIKENNIFRFLEK